MNECSSSNSKFEFLSFLTQTSCCDEASEAHNTLLVHLHSSISGNCVKSHSDRGLGGIFFSILPNPKPGSYKLFDESKKKEKKKGQTKWHRHCCCTIRHDIHFPSSVMWGKVCYQRSAKHKGHLHSACYK